MKMFYFYTQNVIKQTEDDFISSTTCQWLW